MDENISSVIYPYGVQVLLADTVEVFELCFSHIRILNSILSKFSRDKDLWLEETGSV